MIVACAQLGKHDGIIIHKQFTNFGHDQSFFPLKTGSNYSFSYPIMLFTCML